MTDTYSVQLHRVKRYLQRFEEIGSGKAHNQSTPDYDDDVYAFFQNCYHLKDWIKNDPVCSNWIPDVESLVDQNTRVTLAINS